MLILTRRVGETVRITDDISITIERAKPSSVSIGVDAPKSIKVLRNEAMPWPADDADVLPKQR